MARGCIEGAPSLTGAFLGLMQNTRVSCLFSDLSGGGWVDGWLDGSRGAHGGEMGYPGRFNGCQVVVVEVEVAE